MTFTVVRSRRIGIGAALMLVLFLASGGVAGAAPPSPTVTAAVGSATGTSSFAATNFPLADVGYDKKEFFLEGNADSYHNSVAGALAANGVWSVVADGATKHYKTRAFVFKPSNPADFNGTVYLEWLNVSGGLDAAADWLVDHVEMIREGAIYVGLTTQATGVNTAINNDPAFYGPSGANLQNPSLPLPPPGTTTDSYSYDIFSQGGQGVRDNQALLFGPGYTLNKLIATGESQSAGRMVTYINALQPLHHVYDGFLVHSRGATATALRAAVDTGLTAVTASSPTQIRSDIGVPVFEFQTETDSRLARQTPSSTLAYWEVAGSAHFDAYGLGAGTVDEGESPNNAAANALFDAMIHPVTTFNPNLAPCTFGVNAGPHHWALQAALHHLNEWVTNGTTPPSQPVLATVGGTGAGALILDGNGNATGGVRSPHLDVPIAELRGSGNTSSGGGLNFCQLFGTSKVFSDAKLLSLYPNHTAFVNLWNAAVDTGVSGGYILAADAPMLKRSAEVSLIGEHVRHVAENSRSSSGNSNITATVGAEGVAVGDTVVVSVATGTFNGQVGCSDNKGNPYALVADKNTGNGRLFTCSAKVVTALGAGDVVTATYPGFSGLSVVSVNKILAYASTGVTDGVSMSSGSNPPVNSGNITTTHAADLLFGVVAHTSPSTLTPGSGFEVVGEVSAGSGAGQKTVSPMFKAVYSIGTYNATAMLSGSGFWQAELIGYQSP